MRAYTEWKAWADKWLGKRQPGWFGARDRKEKPAAPVWLSDYCRDPSLVQASFAEGAGSLLTGVMTPATALIRKQMQKKRTRGEAVERTKWWNHVHIDAFWLTTQAPVTYGVVGIHPHTRSPGDSRYFWRQGRFC